MSDKRTSSIYTLAKQGSISLFGDGFGRGLRFGFVVLMTRLVSPSTYGVFTLSLTIALFTQAFASLNLYRAIDYFIPSYLENNEYGKANRTFINVIKIGSFSALCVAILIALSAGLLSEQFNEPDLLIALPLIAPLVISETVKKSLIFTAQSIKELQYRVLIRDFTEPIFRIIIPAALVFFGMGLTGIVLGYVLASVMAIFFGGMVLIHNTHWLTIPKKRVSNVNISKVLLFKYSIPLMFAGVGYSLVSQIDYFVIGYFMSASDVGQYRVAWMLAANVLMIHMAADSIVKPIIAENKNDPSAVSSKYQLATRWASILTVPIVLTLILAPEIYLSFLFTSAYNEASVIMGALCLGYLINVMTGVKQSVLDGLGLTQFTFINSLVMLATNGVVNILLVPRIGMLGAAIGTATAMSVNSVLGVVELYHYHGLQPYSGEFVRIVFAIAPTVIVGYLFVELVQEEYIVIFILPILIIFIYIYSIKMLRGFSKDDTLIAEAIDARIGHTIFARIIR